ncbi:adhesion G-protein coupled receptor G1 isoform X2 [Boleophthalmus pectinirostris]|uniref:adhesion G-protein coupled receptor G1 isoform X2 n=1 Tax=Boleophthalmus pectinirostris TaxID=150288 RepID=UPI0024308EE9|nr:adhesion G-protein coupled receptor G1 isoform X2 [Boleophthalmus pectinirostris]
MISPMEPRLARTLWTVLFVAIFTSPASAQDDRNLKFCGTWRHGKGPLSLNVNLTTGCDRFAVSANESDLSVMGQITAQCTSLVTVPLTHIKPTEAGTDFCVYWEPLVDQLRLKIGKEVLPLCSPASLNDNCCTHLSPHVNRDKGTFGITNGTVRDDVISEKTWAYYDFNGSHLNCRKTFCETSQGSTQLKLLEEETQNPCAQSTALKLEDSVVGYNVTFTPPQGVAPEVIPSIHLPPALKKATKFNNEVVCTYFRNTSLFQEAPNNAKILSDVVSISIDNEIIKDLSEPIKIGFHHDVIPKTHSRKCVSWDTRKDTLKVNWLEEGCETQVKGEKQTECHCNHLTYFTVLVELKPKPVRHLLALTAITSLGCAVSLISCIALIVFLCRKSRRSKELSIPIHMGLAVSLALLNLLFFFTGVLANVSESVCGWVGAALHYAMLSSLIWMGIEVFHTFWLVQMVFSPTPKPWIWNLVGFGAPAVPVIILAIIPDIYGMREIHQIENSNPYKMCWMKINDKALLAHYVINLTLLAMLVSSGLVMLFMVYREIRNRDEWRQNRVAFLSIWGLSCLFGTTWGLTFLDFGPLTDFVLFLSCILNSFQGFLLMLRFFMLDWMRKQAGGSVLGSSSTGSTRQHMLQTKEMS